MGFTTCSINGRVRGNKGQRLDRIIWRALIKTPLSDNVLPTWREFFGHCLYMGEFYELRF